MYCNLKFIISSLLHLSYRIISQGMTIVYSSTVKCSQRRKKSCINMRYDISRASDIYRNWISVPLAVFRRSTGILVVDNTIFQELSIEEQGRHWYRTSQQNDAAFRWRRYVYTTCSYDRLGWTLPSSVDFDPGGYEYLELADIVRLSNPSRTTHRHVCPPTRMRARETPT